MRLEIIAASAYKEYRERERKKKKFYTMAVNLTWRRTIESPHLQTLDLV